jgi:hypothetical protein
VSTEAEYRKPLPHLTTTNRPFWEAAHQHKLTVQRCRDCGEHIFFPRPLCPQCYSSNIEWAEVSGRGKVYSFTIVRRPTVRGFDQDAPYIYAVVELEEGPRMVTNIVGCLLDEVRVGMPVEAAYEDVTPEISLVKFRPIAKG